MYTNKINALLDVIHHELGKAGARLNEREWADLKQSISTVIHCYQLGAEMPSLLREDHKVKAKNYKRSIGHFSASIQSTIRMLGIATKKGTFSEQEHEQCKALLMRLIHALDFEYRDVFCKAYPAGKGDAERVLSAMTTLELYTDIRKHLKTNIAAQRVVALVVRFLESPDTDPDAPIQDSSEAIRKIEKRIKRARKLEHQGKEPIYASASNFPLMLAFRDEIRRV